MAAIPLPIEIKSGPLPLNFEGTWKQTFQAMVPRFRGIVPPSKVITGRNSDTAPTYDAGPWWFNAGELQHWRIFDYQVGRYDHDVKQVGTHDAVVTLEKVPGARPINPFTGLVNVDLQDKNGAWALLSDVLVPRQTVIVESTGGVASIDWTDSDNFFLLLKEDTTVTQGGTYDGGIKTLIVENLGTKYNCDFEAAVKWPAGGAEPDTPKSTDPSALGGYAIGKFTFYRINSALYGRLQDYSPANPTGTVDVGGDPPGNYGNTRSGPPEDGSHQRSLY